MHIPYYLIYCNRKLSSSQAKISELICLLTFLGRSNRECCYRQKASSIITFVKKSNRLLNKEKKIECLGQGVHNELSSKTSSRIKKCNPDSRP